MTLAERHEQLSQQLRDATAQRERLTEQLQTTHIAIHQLQGAITVVQQLIQESVELEQRAMTDGEAP